MSTPPGAIGLLAGAISYALGVCAPVEPGELALPTPCTDWDLRTLLTHLGDSMADLETALRTGRLDLEPSALEPSALEPSALDPSALARAPGGTGADPVELLRDRAAALLSASFGYPGPGQFVAVAGLPMPAGLLVCTGAVEIAVHGWDVSAARGRASRARNDGDGPRPIPAGLAARMLRLCPLLMAGREDLFALPVKVPAQAGPGDRLVGLLGRDPW